VASGLRRQPRMKKLITATIVCVLLGSVSVWADAADADHDKQKRSKHQRVAAKEADRARMDVHVSFSTRDVRVIRAYYAPRYRRLPPGLQKKLARTGSLPPGWQKKMEPFPASLERDLDVLPRGYRRGVLDGHAVIYQPGTQVIIDVAVLF
jgi:hypothetical protein